MSTLVLPAIVVDGGTGLRLAEIPKRVGWLTGSGVGALKHPRIKLSL